ncbi:hypothetical protein AGMMS49587_12510 [Spirochaetia bacterium]|nr:hypothetical protein AGMMS49587_12510 [Spirochaetia bacterium]
MNPWPSQKDMDSCLRTPDICSVCPWDRHGCRGAGAYASIAIPSRAMKSSMAVLPLMARR